MSLLLLCNVFAAHASLNYVAPFGDSEMAIEEGVDMAEKLRACELSIPEAYKAEIDEWIQGDYPNGYLKLKNVNVTEGEASQFMCGVGNLLGQSAVGYKTERRGALIHHFRPKRDEQTEQTSESSGVLLECHQEVAYMPSGVRPKFLVLYGVQQDFYKECETGAYDFRNLNDELTEEEKALAQEEGWYVGPDMASLICGDCDDTRPQSHLLPNPLPMLSFDDDGKIKKIEFYDPDTGYSNDERLLQLRKKIQYFAMRDMQWTMITPGDVLIVNNDISVHARKSFRATYDEHDRHIMRTLVADPEAQQFDRTKWEMSYPTCNKDQCVCLNKLQPHMIPSMRLLPEDTESKKVSCEQAFSSKVHACVELFKKSLCHRRRKL